MAFLAYEAYLNLLISRRDPAVWQNERTFFSQSPYRGIEGKLEWLTDYCGQFKVNKGARPYQTVCLLSGRAARSPIARQAVHLFGDKDTHRAQ
jgi:hypothetical protein